MRVRADILRTYQTVHTWTGLCAGLLLFIGFYAGSLTMFKGVINQWANPSSFYLPSINSEQYDLLLDKVLKAHPKAANSLNVYFEADHSPVTWYEKGSARGHELDDLLWHATLNEQGELVTQLQPVNELSMLIDQLHRSAGILGEIGHDYTGVYVLGVAAFLYFIALVSGVIFLLPTLAKSFLALRGKKSVSRFWLDTHNLIGVSSLPFHIIISFTVFVFAFHDLLYDGLSKVYDDKPLFERQAGSKMEHTLAQLPELKTLKAHIKEYAPEHEISMIGFSRLLSKSPSASVRVVNDATLMRGPESDFIFMDPYTLEISGSSVKGGDQGPWADIVSSFFGLHFGSYGGELGRWVYFFMGILGSLLFFTGNLLWIEKRRKSQLPEQSKSSHVLANLTVGIAMGSIAGVIVAFALTKWLSLIAVNINVAYMVIYYGLFFLCLFSCFILGAAKVAIYTSRFITAMCLSIPITSLLALLLPNIGIWPADSFATIVLEIMALVLALCFYIISKKITKRAYAGEPNSVWYIKSMEVGDVNLKEGAEV